MSDQGQDVNEIEEGLFLSSREVAENEEALTSIGITHILTVDTWPLRLHLFTRPENFVSLYLRKNDDDNVDLLSHFEDCNEFIRRGSNVLVHCHVGVSRSAIIVLAFLMNKYRISYEEALARVRAKRPVAPNDGFVDQLKLYERMGFAIDDTTPSYQLLCLTSIASEVGSYMGFANLPGEDRRKLNRYRPTPYEYMPG
ncbi:dual specificity protein phosphatase 1B [Galendromus occidentalis]|uniref:Dual specificity protein phosphatase 1B n=1 Tax=Galendromus occidentalis TaxID=34638 RepID=A0AAJ6QSP5_9ACAR|nr:dual specificity protein phosphatase 1B [Galendromus occidentalis]